MAKSKIFKHMKSVEADFRKKILADKLKTKKATDSYKIARIEKLNSTIVNITKKVADKATSKRYKVNAKIEINKLLNTIKNIENSLTIATTPIEKSKLFILSKKGKNRNNCISRKKMRKNIRSNTIETLKILKAKKSIANKKLNCLNPIIKYKNERIILEESILDLNASIDYINEVLFDNSSSPPSNKTRLYLYEFIGIHESTENDNFLKIGITKNKNMNNRFKDKSYHKYYKINRLHSVRYDHWDSAYLNEQLILSTFNHSKHIPNIKFGGYTECLTRNSSIIKKIIDFMNKAPKQN